MTGVVVAVVVAVLAVTSLNGSAGSTMPTTPTLTVPAPPAGANEVASWPKADPPAARPVVFPARDDLRCEIWHNGEWCWSKR